MANSAPRTAAGPSRFKSMTGFAEARMERDGWALRASLRSVLEHVTLADLARGELPPSVKALAADPDAWAPH